MSSLGHSVLGRPELVARYGYDVKFASHALRLAYQGLEIARDGRLSLPMRERERQRVLDVKNGAVPAVEDVLREINNVKAEVEELLATGRTYLPPEPDWATIGDWSVSAHRRAWGWTKRQGLPCSLPTWESFFRGDDAC